MAFTMMIMMIMMMKIIIMATRNLLTIHCWHPANAPAVWPLSITSVSNNGDVDLDTPKPAMEHTVKHVQVHTLFHLHHLVLYHKLKKNGWRPCHLMSWRHCVNLILVGKWVQRWSDDDGSGPWHQLLFLHSSHSIVEHDDC
jgi:hypothetical protein